MPGAQVAQVLHAQVEFQARHPDLFQAWHEHSNHVCVLSVADLYELEMLLIKAERLNIPLAYFRESDLNDELTAIALAPTEAAKKICSSIPLAFKEFQIQENKKYPTYQEILDSMLSHEQYRGLNMLQHGKLAYDWYCYFLNLLTGRIQQNRNCRLPKWFEFKDDILKNLEIDLLLMEEYLTYHDAGKGFCKIITDGKVHYPNHADISSKLYYYSIATRQTDIDQSEFILDNRALISNLIARDMDIHKIKDKDIPEFMKMPGAFNLLLAGLAEIHANQELFGGLESESFKIKFKQIERRGMACLNWKSTV